MPPKKSPPAVPLNIYGQLADELGSLEKELAPFAQKIARIKQIEKALRAACPVSPDSPWTVDGVRFSVVLSSCANMRGFDVADLIKRIGAKAFSLFASCTLTALEANVTPEICAAVISSKPVGPRTIQTFEKGGTA